MEILRMQWSFSSTSSSSSLIIAFHIAGPLYEIESLMYEVFVFCDHCNQYCESPVCNGVLKVRGLCYL